MIRFLKTGSMCAQLEDTFVSLEKGEEKICKHVRRVYMLADFSLLFYKIFFKILNLHL